MPFYLFVFRKFALAQLKVEQGSDKAEIQAILMK
jgi:hypothetical protein